jgi:hypothetical protein
LSEQEGAPTGSTRSGAVDAVGWIGLVRIEMPSLRRQQNRSATGRVATTGRGSIANLRFAPAVLHQLADQRFGQRDRVRLIEDCVDALIDSARAFERVTKRLERVSLTAPMEPFQDRRKGAT